MGKNSVLIQLIDNEKDNADKNRVKVKHLGESDYVLPNPYKLTFNWTSGIRI